MIDHGFHPMAWVSLTSSITALALTLVVDAQAKQAITVERAGTVAWADLVNKATSAPPVLQAVPMVAPYVSPPDVKEMSEVTPPLSTMAPESGNDIDFPGGIPMPQGPAMGINFAALGDNNASIPPDTMGAAGPNHLMTMLNTQVRIQSKGGGTLSTVSLATFWTSGTGLSGSPFDPIVIYDSISSRWIATCGANSQSTSSKVFFAISTTSDPTGNWNYYSFLGDTTGADWADFPGLGVNQNWIAITENMFTVSGNGFTGVKMWVIDKTTALGGGGLTVTVFPTGFVDTSTGYSEFTLKPCVTFGSEPKLYLVSNPGWGWSSTGTWLLRMSEITGTPASPSWAPTAGSPYAGTGFFLSNINFNYSQINAAQLGTGSLLQTNDPRMQNPVFRNGKIWCVHSAGLPATGTANRTAVIWYQFSPSLMVSGGAPIVQSGALDGGNGVHHFFPSIAANMNDDACLGFSRVDSTRYVEAVATGRSAGDAAGTMDPITVVKAGEDSYVKDFGSGRIRWGDYSATVVDPSDDLTFWTVQEYAETDVGSGASDDRWGTWWGYFDGSPPGFTSIAATPSTAMQNVPVTIAFTASEALLANPTVTVNGHAGSYASRSGNDYTYGYTIQSSDPDGDATIVISGSDVAGNPGSESNTAALDVVHPSTVWVDLNHAGIEWGTETYPFDTLAEGITAVSIGGTVKLKASSSSESIEINRDVTIEAIGGTATVGKEED